MSIGMALGALACAPAARIFGETKRPAVVGNTVTVALFLALGLSTGLGSAAASGLLIGIGFFGLTYSLMLSTAGSSFPITSSAAA